MDNKLICKQAASEGVVSFPRFVLIVDFSLKSAVFVQIIFKGSAVVMPYVTIGGTASKAWWWEAFSAFSFKPVWYFLLHIAQHFHKICSQRSIDVLIIEWCCFANISHSARSADPVDILVDGFGQIVVYHVTYVRNIEASCGHSCGNLFWVIFNVIEVLESLSKTIPLIKSRKQLGR